MVIGKEETIRSGVAKGKGLQVQRSVALQFVDNQEGLGGGG